MAFTFTDANFETEALKSDKVVVVDFWAEWCGPCKMMSPIIDKLADDYKEQAVIGKLDVDSESATSIKYGVRSIPTILLMKGGEVVDKVVGATTYSKLEEKLKAAMSA